MTGDKLTAEEDDNVTCIFDGVNTKGLVTKDGAVLCVSPEMSRTGRVPFKISIEGKDTLFTGISVFISCEFYTLILSFVSFRRVYF